LDSTAAFNILAQKIISKKLSIVNIGVDEGAWSEAMSALEAGHKRARLIYEIQQAFSKKKDIVWLENYVRIGISQTNCHLNAKLHVIKSRLSSKFPLNPPMLELKTSETRIRPTNSSCSPQRRVSQPNYHPDILVCRNF